MLVFGSRSRSHLQVRREKTTGKSGGGGGGYWTDALASIATKVLQCFEQKMLLALDEEGV